MVTNSYAIDDVVYEYELALTNKTSQTAYRGFGVDPHIYALEMIVDEAAREVGMDPTEFRRRNLIEPDQMPYTLEEHLRLGDYPATLERIQEIIDDERDGGLRPRSRRGQTRGGQVPGRPAECHHRTRRQRLRLDGPSAFGPGGTRGTVA